MEESPLKQAVEISLVALVSREKVDAFSQELADLVFKYEATDAKLHQSEVKLEEKEA